MTNWNLLHGFITVSETKNVSAAAKKLGISQPALSRQLHQLEEHFGVQLFVRRKHGLDLSEQGSRLASELAPHLAALDDRLQALQERVQIKTRSVVIGSLAEIGKSMVYPRVLSLMQNFPQCRCQVKLMGGREVTLGVVSGELDLGVVTSLSDSSDIVAVNLFSEKSILVTRASNHMDIKTASDVHTSSFAAYRDEDPLFLLFLTQLMTKSAAERIMPRFVINDHRSIIETLLANDIFAVMPLHSVAGFLESGLLRKASDFEIINQVWGIRQRHSTNVLAKNILTYLGKKTNGGHR